jgi:16S rRNA (guanine(1405)-N(7))-methyltransferase
LDSLPPYAQWLQTLRAESDADAFRAHLRRMMLCHASTRERLPILEEFYLRAFRSVGPVRSVLDIGCGFNPLAIPWMGLQDDAMYEGYDIYSDMTGFLEAAITGLPEHARPAISVLTVDVSTAPPATGADVALILKYLPLLDHKNGEQTLSWMRQLNTRYAIVSFPTRTLGGRNVGMAQSYEASFSEILQALGWQSERIEFRNELCFVVEINSSDNNL